MYVCMYVCFPHWHIAGDRELTWLGGESRVNLLRLVTGLAFVLSNKACFVRRGGGSHMMKQSAGLVLTTLNGFVIVGLEIVVVL